MMGPDIADAFCELVDEFSASWTNAYVYALAGEDLSPEVARVVRAGELPRDMREPNGAASALITAMVIDRVLQRCLFDRGDVSSSRAFPEIAERLARTGRMNADAPGALLPRRGHPSENRRADSVHDCFAAVTRVPPDDWANTDFNYLTDARDRLPLAGARIVACLPSCDTLNDFSLEVVKGTSYALGPAGSVCELPHVAQLLDAADASGAQIAMLPEGTLNGAGLSVWQTAIQSCPRPVASQLSWILAGTGPVDSVDPPPNQAVLLSRLSGMPIARQNKRFQYSLTAEIQQDWLLDLPGTSALDEHIRLGDRVVVVEDPRERAVMLICEDFARPMHQASQALALGPSLCLVPVFDRELDEARWHATYGKVWGAELGSVAVISNSLAVYRRRAMQHDVDPDFRVSDTPHSAAIKGYDERYHGKLSDDAYDAVVFNFHETT